jgi:hypothetical protein
LGTSPYHPYNLWRNPFGEITRQERAEQAVVEDDGWVEYLEKKRAVLQFIGPCGFGKTTHLLALQRAMGTIPYIYLPEDGRQPKVGHSRPMIVDEAQRLSYWQLRRVLKVGGPLVFGTHDDLSPSIRRAGLDVQTIEVAAWTTPQRIAEILNRRIESSRLSEGTIPVISVQHAAQWQSRFGVNIRAIEHFLYEEFQCSAQQRVAWPPPLS